MANIVTAMRTAAKSYFDDGSIDHAVPPLQALLHIMRDGAWQGHSIAEAPVRDLFEREHMLKSGWYRARLEAQQRRDIAHWEKRAVYLDEFLARPNYADIAARAGIRGKLAAAQASAALARKPSYVDDLVGTLGVDPQLS
jgi:hypothetical protein